MAFGASASATAPLRVRRTRSSSRPGRTRRRTACSARSRRRLRNHGDDSTAEAASTGRRLFSSPADYHASMAAILRTSCVCGWETTGPEDEVVEATLDHGLRVHNMGGTREDVLARAERLEEPEPD